MSAKTVNNILHQKYVDYIMVFPVDSGETILQNTIAGIGVDGLLKEVAPANVASIVIPCIIADDSINLTPAPTTADGNLLADRSSPDAGDKTVRQVWTRGLFLLDFVDTLSADEVGKVAYARNNNDCSILSVGGVKLGTIVSVYSTSKAWVELNTYYGEGGSVKTVKVAVVGSASTAVGAQLSILNPFAEEAILESFIFDIDTASTGGATMDIGVGLGSSVDTLMDGLTLNGAVTGIKTPTLNGGTNGKACPHPVAVGDGVVGTASASTVGLVATAEAKFRRWI